MCHLMVIFDVGWDEYFVVVAHIDMYAYSHFIYETASYTGKWNLLAGISMDWHQMEHWPASWSWHWIIHFYLFALIRSTEMFAIAICEKIDHRWMYNVSIYSILITLVWILIANKVIYGTEMMLSFKWSFVNLLDEKNSCITFASVNILINYDYSPTAIWFVVDAKRTFRKCKCQPLSHMHTPTIITSLKYRNVLFSISVIQWG